MDIEKKKFRCHVSIIFEQCAQVIGALILYMGVQFIDLWMELFGDDAAAGALDEIAGTLLLGVAILVLVLLFAIIKWRKTTISLEEDAIIWEKNTLHKKTLTIGIKNISSINIERNLFERIVGTAKLKLDTASLSTADSTDVLFVFRLEDAMRYKEYLEGKASISDDSRVASTGADEKEAGHGKTISADDAVAAEYTSQLTEILRHCFYDISIVSVLFCVLLTGVGIYLAVDSLKSGNIEAVTGDIIAAVVVIGPFLYAFFRSTLGKLLDYYNLTVSRKGNQIHMKYGLLKVKEYVVPVEKINAVKIRQTWIGRLCKRYNASIECVGVGDEKEEIAQLTLSLPYEEMNRRLSGLLPEYNLTPVKDMKKIPKAALLHKTGGLVIFTVIVTAFWIGTAVAFREMGATEIDKTFGCIATALILAIYAYIILTLILQMRTEAVGLYNGFMAIATGSFGRSIVITPYKKIQYVSINKFPFCRFTGLVSGNIHILAQGLNSIKSVPYIRETDVELLKEKICDRSR